jgi:hypothetical protein
VTSSQDMTSSSTRPPTVRLQPCSGTQLKTLPRSFSSVCTQNDGDSVRVDLLPPLAGAIPLPETTQRDSRPPEMYEGGCGSPVSPTPPYAVAEAAALAVRHACALLLEAPLNSAGEAHEYPRPADD